MLVCMETVYMASLLGLRLRVLLSFGASCGSDRVFSSAAFPSLACRRALDLRDDLWTDDIGSGCRGGLATIAVIA